MSSRGQRIYSLEKRSLFVLSLLFSFCIILGVACIIAYHSYTKEIKATIRSNETRANLLAKLILEHQRAAVGVLRSYGSRSSLKDSVKRKDFEATVRHLTDLVKNNPEVEWPFIANPDSTVWVNFPVDKRAFNKDLSYRDWYKGVKREWKPYISTVFKLIVGEQDLAVAVSVPIFDEEGAVIGILNTAQSTAFFRKIIGEVSSNSDANTTLIDQEGHIICSNRFPYTKEVIDYPSFDFVRRAIKGEEGNVEIQDSSDGNGIKYVSFAPIQGIGWSIIVEKARSEMLRSEYPHFVLIAAISFLMYVVVALSLVHVRERNRRLAELEILNAGLEERVRRRTSELNAANQELKGEIAERKRTEEALRVSNQFLKIANQKTTIKPVLNEFVVEIQRFTQCAAVGIRILDEQGNIPYQAYKGFDQRFYESESPLSIKSDQCMCINVIKGVTDRKLPFYTEGGSFYMNATTHFLATVSQEEKRKTRNECNRVGFESVALVPIRFGKEILGLIHVADSSDNMVPLETVETLEQVAMQLGEAIQRLQAEEEIRKLNSELEQKVIERTAQLEKANRGLTEEIAVRQRSELEVKRLNEDLERQTVELRAINQELEAFSYSVSHDLRSPLRSMDGFSQAVLEDCADKLDEQGKDYLQRVRAASQHMAELIDDLLTLSRVTRSEMHWDEVDLAETAEKIAREFREKDPDRQVELVVTPELMARGDARLLKIMMENLLSNAWKFTGKHSRAKIELGVIDQGGARTYYVRDDGVGFDMAYVDKLFTPFQRLHGAEEFPGTGIGLATIRRIVHRHGGRVWAEGEVEKGATFYFTLP